MKKVLLALLFIAGLGYRVSAQTSDAKSKISIGPEFAIPTGDLSNVYSSGYGASVQGEFNIAKSLNLTGSAGYMTFAVKKEIRDLFKESGEDLPGSHAIPLKAGAKFYFLGNFYGLAETGVAINTGEGSRAAFVYAPTIGTSFEISSKTALDLGIRYESWSNDGASSFVGVRAAFKFAL